MTNRAFIAWAISHHIVGHWNPCFTGIFSFVHDNPPPHQNGCRTALFSTREAARKALPEIRKGWGVRDVRVAKVSVTIAEIERNRE